VLVVSFFFLITSSFNFSKNIYRREANMEVILCFKMPHLKTLNGCNHNQMNLRIAILFFGHFHFFINFFSWMKSFVICY
jgi:hypothetical protein